MEIYIEFFLIENILINFCLIKLIHSTTKFKTSFYKILLASIVGSVFSIFPLIIITNNMLINFVKFTTAVFMITLAFNSNLRQTTFGVILLFLYTYALGGLIININSNSYFTAFGFITTSQFNLELICLIVIISTYIFDLALKHIKLKIKTNNLIQKIKLTQGQKSIFINGYLDTGNFINHNGSPVLILELNSFLKLTNSNIIDFLTLKTDTLKTETITGSNKLKMFQIDKLEIISNKHKIEFKKQLVAINTTNCFKNTNYQALLSPLFYN